MTMFSPILAMSPVTQGERNLHRHQATRQAMTMSSSILATHPVVEEGEWNPHHHPATPQARAAAVMVTAMAGNVKVALVGKMKVTFILTIHMGTWIMEHSKDTAMISAATIATASRTCVCNNGAKVACRHPMVHVGTAVVVAPQGRGARKAAARAKAVAVAGLAKTEEETNPRIG